MNASSNWPLFALIMFLSGIGIPIMAAMSGTLGTRFGNPAAASAVVFGGAFLMGLAATFITGAPSLARWLSGPWPFYFAGVFVGAYVLAITYLGPKLGIGNAVFLVLLGQMVAAAAIDHFGLFGVKRAPIDAMRAIGIAIMALGLFLARKRVTG